MTLTEEKQLVDEARKNPEKFGVLFDTYYQQIFNYSLRRVADVATAQDIASTVFFKAYKKLWQFKWRGVPFIAWLYRIANNEIKSFYRKKDTGLTSLNELREVVGYEPMDDAIDIQTELIEAEEKLARHGQFLEVQKEIEELDNKYQEVLHLKYFQKMKIAEISQALNKKPGTIKSLISRGLAKIRENYENKYYPKPQTASSPVPVSTNIQVSILKAE